MDVIERALEAHRTIKGEMIELLDDPPTLHLWLVESSYVTFDEDANLINWHLGADFIERNDGSRMAGLTHFTLGDKLPTLLNQGFLVVIDKVPE